jgi:glyoxylase-like metal-dependent hydrolase (beta-lactamase superfamily II)
VTSSHTIGNYKINVVLDTPAPPRDVSAIFESVPAEAWDQYRSFALDSNGMWITAYRGHLIRNISGEGPIILVDTGMGDVVSDVTGEVGQLRENLSALGVQPDDIDIVVTTHCHGDHIGWNVMYDDDTPRLTFPNATHWIASRDWEFYSKPENANPAFDKSVKPLEELGALKLVDGVEQLAPGIATLPMNGHTPGHQCVLVESGGKTGVLTGDLFHNVAQITEQTWCPVFDWNTQMSTQSRRSLLTLASTQDWIVFSGHLETGQSIGNVVLDGGKASWNPL